jgi:hypothetical protein
MSIQTLCPLLNHIVWFLLLNCSTYLYILNISDFSNT